MSAKGATVLTKTKNRSEDSPKKHKWAQKKLLSHEAQCISNILQNCIRQVEIAAIMPAVLQLNSASCVVNKDLSRAIQDHQILDARLETLDGLNQMSDGEQEEEVAKASAELEKDIKNSFRDLLRVARAHADVISGWRAELSMQVGESDRMLINGLQKFHSHVVEKLLTGLDEGVQHVLHKQVSSFSAHDLEKLVSQEEVVAAALKEMDAKIFQDDKKIKKMQNTPIGDRQEPERSILADKLRALHTRSSKIKQASIQQEIEQLSSQLNTMILTNRQVEREIQEQKNEKLETEIEYMFQIFDNEIEETQSNLELNEVECGKEEEELKTLGISFSALKVEYDEIKEKHRIADVKKGEEMRLLQLKTRAAIIAQSWWRGYTTRKFLKSKVKSKKGKKGKKTKKK